MKDQPWTSPDAPRWKRWAGNVILVLCAIGAWITTDERLVFSVFRDVGALVGGAHV